MLRRKCLQLHPKQNSWAAFVDGARDLKLSSPPLSPSFSSVILSACFSLLQTAFNRVQPAQPERTPTMSQSNPGKYLQTLSGSPQTALADTLTDVDRFDQTGGNLGQ